MTETGHAAFESACRRIEQAYDPKLFEDCGAEVIRQLAEHLASVQQRQTPVLNWAAPEENIRAAAGFLNQAAGEPDVSRLAELVRTILARGQNLHSPRYIGHQVPPPLPLAGLFDATGSITNQVMGIYEMGPWATGIERAVVNLLGERIGWTPGTFSGAATHGGSLANLTALLTARNVAIRDAWTRGIKQERACLVAHADAHYSISRAAGILGLGTSEVLPVDLDAHGRMNPRHLQEVLTQAHADGQTVIAVAASACSTPIGAFDPLEEIASVCADHGVWLHVDAAHGGSVLMSERHRHKLSGIALADSVVWDAHKMLFVPALCALVFFRKQEHGFMAFRQAAPYLFDASAPDESGYDTGLRTMECTKRAATMGLWGMLSLFGESLFEDLVDVTFELSRRFHQLLQAAIDFETIGAPEANIVVFRYHPADSGLDDPKRLSELQADIKRRLVRSGRFYIVQTELDGQVWLRITLMNPLTRDSDLTELLQAVREAAAVND